MSQWLRVGLVTATLALSIAGGWLSACAVQTPGSHKEQRCTLVFQTEKMMVSPQGVLMVDQRDVKSLKCDELWVGPEEEP